MSMIGDMRRIINHHVEGFRREGHLRIVAHYVWPMTRVNVQANDWSVAANPGASGIHHGIEDALRGPARIEIEFLLQ